MEGLENLGSILSILGLDIYTTFITLCIHSDVENVGSRMLASNQNFVNDLSNPIRTSFGFHVVVEQMPDPRKQNK